MKTQIRIALILIAVTTFMLLVYGGSVYYFLSNYSYNDFYKRLETRANISAKYNLDKDLGHSASFRLIREKHLERLPQEKEYILEIRDHVHLEKISLASGLPLSFLIEILTNSKASLQEDNTFYAGIKYKTGGRTYLVIVSADNYYASHHLLFLRNIVLIGFVLNIIITVSLSIYFSKHIFDPIKKIIEKVNTISTNNIHLRLDESKNDNEISQLISTFNNLLNRLETAFETQKNFISNASHEFGTPLTSIIGEAEVALKRQRSPTEYEQALKTILEQAERINQLTQSLLMLAQAGYRKMGLRFELLRTDELIWKVKGIIDKINPKNNIVVDISLLPENPKKLKIMGDTQLMYLAFTNLLMNACKYSNNKPVHVSIASGSDYVLLVFTDHGIGIPPEDMPYIYDPFFRASNAHQYEGYGIGLPLARNIIQLHHGHLGVSSVLGKGTTVEIKLPVARV